MIVEARDRIIQKAFLPGQNPSGKTIAALIVKRTYDFKHRYICTRAEQDFAIHTADTPYGDPMNSTIQYEADFVAYKSATDVVLNGYAYYQPDSENNEIQCSLSIDDHHKHLCILGDRQAEINKTGEVLFTTPQSFKRIELKYENAYGGIDVLSDKKQVFPYPRNHMGKGFIVSPQKKLKIALPNIEDIDNRLTEENLLVDEFENWNQQPLPQGFGWYSKAWEPRGSLAGGLPGHKEFEDELFEFYTKDMSENDKEIMDSIRLPSMDFNFFNGASEGLTLPFLQGNEIIRTVNLTKSGICDFQLPNDKPDISLELDDELHTPEAKLYTVMIRMEDKQVDLTWCGTVECPSLEWLVSRQKINFEVE